MTSFLFVNFIKNERKFDMKNFKLLLATTAILSTGALMANAIEGESAQVDVKAELIKARVLTPTPLDFGRIVFSQGVYELAVDVRPAKSETASGPVVIDEVLGGTAYVLTQGKRGTVTGATCSQLDYPDTSSGYLPFTTVPDDAPSTIAFFIWIFPFSFSMQRYKSSSDS